MLRNSKRSASVPMLGALEANEGDQGRWRRFTGGLFSGSRYVDKDIVARKYP